MNDRAFITFIFIGYMAVGAGFLFIGWAMFMIFWPEGKWPKPWLKWVRRKLRGGQ